MKIVKKTKLVSIDDVISFLKILNEKYSNSNNFNNYGIYYTDPEIHEFFLKNDVILSRFTTGVNKVNLIILDDDVLEGTDELVDDILIHDVEVTSLNNLYELINCTSYEDY